MSINFEHRRGFTWPYLIMGQIKQFFTFNRYAVPSYGPAGRLFAITAEKLKGSKSGDRESILEEAVNEYGIRRGRETAEIVKSKGRELSLRNMLIYNDLKDNNFKARASIKDGDLILKVTKCNFYYYAKEWGCEEGTHSYCNCEDGAFLTGYNPSIKIEVEPCYKSGKQYCLIHYKVKGEIKEPTL